MFFLGMLSVLDLFRFSLCFSGPSSEGTRCFLPVIRVSDPVWAQRLPHSCPNILTLILTVQWSGNLSIFFPPQYSRTFIVWQRKMSHSLVLQLCCSEILVQGCRDTGQTCGLHQSIEMRIVHWAEAGAYHPGYGIAFKLKEHCIIIYFAPLI